ALGKVADRFKLMTYDYSGAWSGPGPIGPLFWAKKCVAFAEKQGVAKHKIFLGIPFYGRDWGGGSVHSVTAPEAAKRALHAISGVHFDAPSGEAHFQYVSGGATHTVWFSSAKSIE